MISSTPEVWATWITLLLLCGLTLWLTGRSGSPWASPVTVTGVSWLIAITLALLPGAMDPQITLFVPALAVVLVIACTGGVLLASSVRLRNVRSASGIDATKLRKIHLILLALLTGYVVWQSIQAWPVISSIGGLDGIWNASGNRFRTAQRLARLQQIQSGGSFLDSVIGYVLFSGHASLVTGGLLWWRERRLLAIAPLGVLLVYTLLTLERTTFAVGALLLTFSIVAMRPRGRATRHRTGRGSSRVRSFFAVAVVSSVALVALLLPLLARNRDSANSTGVTSLVQYVLSGIAGLNMRSPSLGGWGVPVDPLSGIVGATPGWGSYTFFGFFDILRRAGFSVPVAPPSASYYPVAILGESFNTNVATLLTDFYYDLGWAGLIVFPALLSFAAMLSLRLVADGRPSWLGFYACFMSALAWSFFGNAVLTDLRYLIVAFVAMWAIRAARSGKTPAEQFTDRRRSRSESYVPLV